MSEIHLRQVIFTYSAYGHFTKSKEQIQKGKETGDSEYIYQNEIDKACFQRDMAYWSFKDLSTRGTIANKILVHKTFNIAENRKYDVYKGIIASMVHKLLDKKTASIAQSLILATRVKSASITERITRMNSDVVSEKNRIGDQLIANLKNLN